MINNVYSSAFENNPTFPEIRDKMAVTYANNVNNGFQIL